MARAPYLLGGLFNAPQTPINCARNSEQQQEILLLLILLLLVNSQLVDLILNSMKKV